jgi:hypothetical protein
MTVIFGVNLSDRVYIAGDSRISDIVRSADGRETVIPKSDNILKVDLVKGDGGVALACAGDAKFAAYLINNLYKQEFSKRGIRSIRVAIEEWARFAAHEYFLHNQYTAATLILAGSDTSQKKKVAVNRILSFARPYLEAGERGAMKRHLVEALEKYADKHGDRVTSAETELNISDTVLFSIKLNRRGIEIVDTVFGEFLLYGPEGVIKDDIEERHIGRLEYALNSDIKQDIITIIAMLHQLVESKGLESVGGCIIPIGAFHDGMAYFIDGQIQRQDRLTGRVETINAFYRRGGNFYRDDERGSWRKMIRVADYTPIANGGLYI